MTDGEIDVNESDLEVDEEILPGVLEDGTELDPHDSAPAPEEEQ